MLIDEFLPKVEEWVERSNGKVRADVAHDKLVALGFTGSERTTRRAIAVVKKNYRLGRVRVHRPWVTEPGMWLQYDFGDGPVIDGVKTTLFCAWLAWSRFRVVLAIRDKTAPSVMAALDVTLRRLGGAPTYLLTLCRATSYAERMRGRLGFSSRAAVFEFGARHNQRLIRNARRLSGGVYRPRLVLSGAVRARAFSLSAMLACT
jgi:hypothetical protein